MKKHIFIATLLLYSAHISAQVGINTQTPKATLDIVKQDENNTPDGLLLPRFTADEIKARENAYGEAQNGTMVFITQPVTYNASYTGKASEITSTGIFYYNHTLQKWVSATSGSTMNIRKISTADVPGTPLNPGIYLYEVKPDDDIILISGKGDNGTVKLLLPWDSNDFPVGKKIYVSNTSYRNNPLPVGVHKKGEPDLPGTRDYSPAARVYSGYTQVFMYIGDKNTPDPNDPGKYLSPWINLSGI